MQIILPIIHFSFYFGKFEVLFTGIFHYSFVLPLSYHRDCLCKYIYFTPSVDGKVGGIWALLLPFHINAYKMQIFVPIISFYFPSYFDKLGVPLKGYITLCIGFAFWSGL